MTDIKTCANPACSCIPPEKEKFCSAHCEGLGDKVEVLCGCGHDSCRGAAAQTVVRTSPVGLGAEGSLEREGGVGNF